MRIHKTHLFRILLWLTVGGAITSIFLGIIYINRQFDEKEIRLLHQRVVHKTGYALIADKDTIFFIAGINRDSTFIHIDSLMSPTLHSDTTIGAWVNEWAFLPSCNGYLLTRNISPNVDSISNFYNNCIDSVIAINLRQLEANTNHILSIQKEVEYYLSVHNLMDTEFGMVESYSRTLERETNATLRYISLLEKARASRDRYIAPISIYEGFEFLPFNLPDDSYKSRLQHMECYPKDIVLLQGIKPDSALAFSLPLLEEHNPEVIPQYIPEAVPFKPLHVFTDTLGTYTGQRDKNGYPQGLGILRYHDGSYYQGQWSKGLRHGSGFYIASKHSTKGATPVFETSIKAGEWEEDKYKGERMVYSDARVYGIDVSRYQHEIGRKRYGINWSQLRITSLGPKNDQNAILPIDYPVSFVYIKSTQGTTIKSKYYASDAKAARKAGLRVGAYHFYSTIKPALAQAQYFCKQTQVLPSDLPPVLDVEPTDAQVRKMGGEKALLQSIRIWMEVVEGRTGKRPILYVSQTFIRKYLSKAPDICQKYQIWIARYSEYRPEVKLLFWQLSPKGRVKGIHGDVDINVYNGFGELEVE